jgi:hypothetical protein
MYRPQTLETSLKGLPSTSDSIELIGRGKMNKPSFKGRLLLAAAAVIFCVSDAVAAPPACSDATLFGPYGFLFQGPIVNTVGNPTVATYAAFTGVLVFDGRGNFTVTRTDNINGAITPP